MSEILIIRAHSALEVFVELACLFFGYRDGWQEVWDPGQQKAYWFLISDKNRVSWSAPAGFHSYNVEVSSDGGAEPQHTPARTLVADRRHSLAQGTSPLNPYGNSGVRQNNTKVSRTAPTCIAERPGVYRPIQASRRLLSSGPALDASGSTSINSIFNSITPFAYPPTPPDDVAAHDAALAFCDTAGSSNQQRHAAVHADTLSAPASPDSCKRVLHSSFGKLAGTGRRCSDTATLPPLPPLPSSQPIRTCEQCNATQQAVKSEGNINWCPMCKTSHGRWRRHTAEPRRQRSGAAQPPQVDMNTRRTADIHGQLPSSPTTLTNAIEALNQGVNGDTVQAEDERLWTPKPDAARGGKTRYIWTLMKEAESSVTTDGATDIHGRVPTSTTTLTNAIAASKLPEDDSRSKSTHVSLAPGPTKATDNTTTTTSAGKDSSQQSKRSRPKKVSSTSALNASQQHEPSHVDAHSNVSDASSVDPVDANAEEHTHAHTSRPTTPRTTLGRSSREASPSPRGSATMPEKGSPSNASTVEGKNLNGDELEDESDTEHAHSSKRTADAPLSSEHSPSSDANPPKRSRTSSQTPRATSDTGTTGKKISEKERRKRKESGKASLSDSVSSRDRGLASSRSMSLDSLDGNLRMPTPAEITISALLACHGEDEDSDGNDVFVPSARTPQPHPSDLNASRELNLSLFPPPDQVGQLSLPRTVARARAHKHAAELTQVEDAQDTAAVKTEQPKNDALRQLLRPQRKKHDAKNRDAETPADGKTGVGTERGTSTGTGASDYMNASSRIQSMARPKRTIKPKTHNNLPEKDHKRFTATEDSAIIEHVEDWLNKHPDNGGLSAECFRQFDFGQDGISALRNADSIRSRYRKYLTLNLAHARFLQLRSGSNPVPLEVSSHTAPETDMSVAGMHSNNFKRCLATKATASISGSAGALTGGTAVPDSSRTFTRSTAITPTGSTTAPLPAAVTAVLSAHAVLERARRNDLKISYQILQETLPSLAGSVKAPTVQILRSAIDEVHTLQKDEGDLIDAVAAAKSETAQVKEPDTIRSSPAPLLGMIDGKTMQPLRTLLASTTLDVAGDYIGLTRDKMQQLLKERGWTVRGTRHECYHRLINKACTSMCPLAQSHDDAARTHVSVQSKLQERELFQKGTQVECTEHLTQDDNELQRWLYAWNDGPSDPTTGWWISDGVGADEYFAFCLGHIATPEGCGEKWTTAKGQHATIDIVRINEQTVRITTEINTLSGVYSLAPAAATAVAHTVYMRTPQNLPDSMHLVPANEVTSDNTIPMAEQHAPDTQSNALDYHEKCRCDISVKNKMAVGCDGCDDDFVSMVHAMHRAVYFTFF